MVRLVSVVAAMFVVAACSVDHDYSRTTLEFEPLSPAIPGGGEDILIARGSLIYTAMGRITKDGGASWASSNPAVIPSQAEGRSDSQMLVGTTAFGLGRWDMMTDQVNPVGAPAGTTITVYHLRANNTLIAGTTTANMARQGSDLQWSTPVVPMPPTGTYPNPPNPSDIDSSPSVIIAATTWGVYRSADDGASWEFVYQPSVLNGNKVVVLSDGSFLITKSNNTADILDATGANTGMTTTVFPNPTMAVDGCLGGIINGDKYSDDLGQTWKPLFGMQPVSLSVTSYSCGGDYLLAFVNQPNRWLIKMAALGRLGELMTFLPNMDPGQGGSALFQTADGRFMFHNLAWKAGESAWTLAVVPGPAQFYPLDDGSILAVSMTNRSQIWRSSDGVTWEMSMLAAPVPVADKMFVDSQGTLWASSNQNMIGQVFKSTDKGATWMPLASAMAMQIYLVGMANDVLVGSAAMPGALFVSRDHGASWESMPFPLGFNMRFVTHHGNAVTFDTNDETQMPNAFHLWRDYGVGNAFQQVTPLNMEPKPIDLSSVLTSVTFDAQDYVYWYGGATLQAIWRSKQPID